MNAGPDGGRDDWFAEPKRAPAPESRGTDDDWLADDDAYADASWRELLDTLSEWRAILIPLTLVILLLVGLALGGVFSSGHKASQSTTALSVTVATHTSTATATAAAAASTPAPTTTLKPGDNGTQVTSLQRALNGLGYSVGTPDGVYGPSTQAALAKFQSASHLTSDGVFGPATLAALVSALNGP